MHVPFNATTPPVSSEYAVSRKHAWTTFGLLFVLMLFDYIDRSIVASMFPYIKKDWGLTDTQLGSLASIVALTVGIFSLPIAVLVDRWSRVKSIVVMGVIWSLATITCMFAGNYGQLLVLRGAIGVGEAGYGNAGSALLAHHFPSKMRSTIIGIFYLAVSVGSMLGIIFGGIIAARWGWKAAFGIVGVPGIVFALAILFVRDYKTVSLKKITAPGNASASKMSVPEVARELFKAKTLLPTYFGSGLALIVYMAMNSWLPSYFARIYNLQGAEAGLKAAPIILVAACGTAIWAMIGDRLGLRHPRRKLHVTVACSLMTILILFPTFMWIKPGTTQYLFIMLGAFMMGSVGGITTAIAMDVTHPGLRSTACSMVTLANNVIGFTLGPLIVGVLSDRFGLQAAMALVTLFALPAAACLYFASRTYTADKALIDSHLPGLVTEGEPRSFNSLSPAVANPVSEA